MTSDVYYDDVDPDTAEMEAVEVTLGIPPQDHAQDDEAEK